MKTSSLINNVKSLEWGLTLQEAYLFSWIAGLHLWSEKIFLDGKVFYFASKTKAINDNPLITDKIDTMYRFYRSIEKKGLIEIKRVDGKDYLSITEMASEWEIYKSDPRKIIRESSEKNPKTLGFKSDILSNNTIKELYNSEDAENPLNPLEKVGFYSDIDRGIFQMKSDTSWKSTYGKQAGIKNPNDCDAWIDRYRDHAIASGKNSSTLKDLKSHCLNWTRKRINAGDVIQRKMTEAEKNELRNKRFSS